MNPTTPSAPISIELPTPSPAATDNGDGRNVVAKALALLEALAEPNFDPKPAIELAKRVGLHRSTALRQLRMLEEAGWAVFDSRYALWSLSPRVIGLATRYQRWLDLQESRTGEVRRKLAL